MTEPPDDRAFLYEERAAIKQFCANLPREQAEREARAEIYGPEQTGLWGEQ